MNYFYTFKNGQNNLFKYCINPGLHIYLYLCDFPFQNPWPFQSWRCLIILGRIKERKEGLNSIRSPPGPFFPRPSRAERPPAPSLTASPSFSSSSSSAVSRRLTNVEASVSPRPYKALAASLGFPDPPLSPSPPPPKGISPAFLLPRE